MMEKHAADEIKGNARAVARPTHRGAGGILLSFAAVAAAGLWGAGRRARGTHQVEHMVLILLWEPIQLITVQSPGLVKLGAFRPS